jgi:hypothetical protein
VTAFTCGLLPFILPTPKNYLPWPIGWNGPTRPRLLQTTPTMSSKYTAPRMRRKMAGKPNKPYSTFPLTPHASGKWQKKIRGQIFYFGNWARHENGKLVRIDGDGWMEALELYKSQADDLYAGRAPRLKNDGLTLANAGHPKTNVRNIIVRT